MGLPPPAASPPPAEPGSARSWDAAALRAPAAEASRKARGRLTAGAGLIVAGFALQGMAELNFLLGSIDELDYRTATLLFGVGYFALGTGFLLALLALRDL